MNYPTGVDLNNVNSTQLAIYLQLSFYAKVEKNHCGGRKLTEKEPRSGQNIAFPTEPLIFERYATLNIDNSTPRGPIFMQSSSGGNTEPHGPKKHSLAKKISLLRYAIPCAADRSTKDIAVMRL